MPLAGTPSDSPPLQVADRYTAGRTRCDKIAEKNDKSLTGHQAMDRARARMTRLGSGSRELFVEGRDG